MASRTASPGLLLLLLWGVFIVYGTTLPFDADLSLETMRASWHRASKVPWVQQDGGFPSLPDMVSNVMLFVPWGLLLAWNLHRRQGRGAVLGTAMLASALLSGFVEFLQLFLPGRITSPTDLLTNTAGGVFGAWLGWEVATRLVPRWRGPLQRSIARGPLGALAAAVLLGMLVAAFSPFDLSIDVDALKLAVKTARPIPFGDPIRGEPIPSRPWDRASGALAWSLVGGVFLLALRERGWSPVKSALGAGVFATLAAGTGELVQLIVQSRSTDATTVFLAGVGALGGAFVALAIRPRGRSQLVGTAFLVWLLAQACNQLAPGGFASPSWEGGSVWAALPFIHYFIKTDVHALADAVHQILVYLPLGALWRLSQPHRSSASAAWVGAAIALPLELAQLFVPARVAESTDAVTAALGAYFGSLAWEAGLRAWRRRAGGQEASVARESSLAG